MEKLEFLINKYNIVPIFNNNLIGDATGLGDIMFRILCIKNNLIKGPFNFNLTWFTKLYYKMDPINQLEFRINLINDLLKYNNISESIINYFFSNNSEVNTELPYNSIDNFSLNFTNKDHTFNNEEYIIFHTKCRHCISEDYEILKNEIRFFSSNFKSKYKIIIMGERVFPETEEVLIHGITTVYDELLYLKNNNEILDISIENIYSNLNYDNFKKDVEIIKNAKYNICFGTGGQLCSSLIFGKSTIYYSKLTGCLDFYYLIKNNHNCFTNLEDFFYLIKKKCEKEIKYSISNKTTTKLKYAYFLSHLGLGDNITNIGAINFLLNYYETIYFFCKDNYNENVSLLFVNKPVITVPIDSNDPYDDYTYIKKLNNVEYSDIFVSGFHKNRIHSRIAHPQLNEYVQNDKEYNIDYSHIRDFYYDNKLDLSIYYEYFDIESSKSSINLYNDIKNYKIIFMHTESSAKEINLDNIVDLYKDNDEYIIICANKNVYDIGCQKYNKVEKYVNEKVAYYIDIIKNAEIIHVVDSCFSCIILPLLKTNRLKSIETVIHSR